MKSIIQPTTCTLLDSVSEPKIAAQPYSMLDSAPPVTSLNLFERLALNEVAPAPNVQVPYLARSELGPDTDGDCNEAPVGRVALAVDLLPQNKAQNVSVVLEAGPDLVMPGSYRSASVAHFDEALISVSHYRLMPPRSGCSHPVVIKHPADAVFDESSAAISSLNQHVALANQHGKSPSSAQLALVCHQERHVASFAEVLRCGLVVDAIEDLLGAATDAVSSGLPTEAEVEDDPAVDSSYSPHDALYVHHVKAQALDVNLGLTPNSITLSSKYSLDAAGLVGHDTISPRSLLAAVREG
ncbi:hypothetical protein Nepgr_002815 [Nepenthes gracilis]|uniref:Uncharacterized protein n=1 Tax=Nepenthes gracilis TaxID=150966 RepID=A0AAD3P7J0_NEPGR|nr:hypothetical protein Nepgr_002815 [Nepenthes gracilis]